MNFAFFLKEAFRGLSRNSAPALAALLTVLLTALVLGVFIPIVQATTGTANEVRSRVAVDVYVEAGSTAAERTQLREGRIVRDELSGHYRPDESTTEFAVRLRGELGVGDEGHPN